MNKKMIIGLCVIGLSLNASAQFNLGGLKDKAEAIVAKPKAGLSNEEVVSGLRDALKVGANNASGLASKADGFYKNDMIFIPFPEEAKKVKTKAEALGMKSEVDKFTMTLNRAAEEASKEAAPIFIDAILGMSVSDGFKILKGEDDAATNYLKKSTSAALTAKFQPIIQKAIEKVKLTAYWNPIITKYNSIPFVDKVNPDLEKYVTERALIGLFKLIAVEEGKIRTDPAARVTDILKKVFA